ncbi:MAG: ribonuclease D [Acidimicrobiales bacterium]|nr:ribonuclease D [Acidimicrobiales bacterium]
MPEEPGYRIVDTDEQLDEVVDQLLDTDRYAIDTEFHRERTYYPQLALIQIAWPGDLVLIDPIAVDPEPLAEVFRSTDVEAVLHACSQDLEVLELVAGAAPSRIFDTQIAAAFVGMRTPSLASLHDQLLGLKLPKANRLTDWLRRPLEPEQQAYAASDVAHLLEIQDLLIDQLEDNGRLAWADDECELARTKGLSVRKPEEAWLRIKEARSLGARARTAAQQLAAWRERSAQDRNIPVRHVLPDLAIVALAQKAPSDPADVGRTRGLERRGVSKRDAAEIVEVISEAKDMPPPPTQPRKANGGPDLRPAVTLIAAWMSQYADDMNLDPAMLGSRSDIEEFVRSGESRLAHGWRHDLAGSAIRSLLAGDAAVAFDGDGRVIVEKRSHVPIDGDNFAG